MRSLVVILLLFSGALYAQIETKIIDTGMELMTFPASQTAMCGDNMITVLKVDPDYFSFRLRSANETGKLPKTAPKWAEEYHALVVVNAGMFRTTGLNCGYMFIDGTLNGQLNKDNAFLVMGPYGDDIPAIQIIDRVCDDWEPLIKKYRYCTQSIRMVDCHRNNVWTQQDKKWSMVIAGIDQDGNALFAFTRSPYSVHDFIEMLLQAPVGLQQAIYLEGGPEASLYINHNGFLLEKFGSYETGFTEHDENESFWSMPNIIAIEKK